MYKSYFSNKLLPIFAFLITIALCGHSLAQGRSFEAIVYAQQQAQQSTKPSDDELDDFDSK
jgi:hypothetical protein